MKILIVAPLPPYQRGGIEKVVGELSQRLVQDHYGDVHVWSGTLGSAQACDWNGVHVKTYHTSKRAGFASLKIFRDLKQSARDFDVIHAHGFSSLIPCAAALTAGRTPLVISPHFHPQASSTLLGVLRPLFERTVDRYTLSRAQKVICVSETEADIIRKRFAVKDNVVVIYNGVNADDIQNAEPYKFDGKLILYVGRLERYKNIHLAIEAVDYLPQDFSFYIIGEGPYESELAALIHRKGLSGRVRLLGACADADVFRWMKTSALLVNLSEIEAFGITVLESLAAGTPTLVNDKLGLRELARLFHSAVFSIRMNKVSPQELAKAIEDVAGTQIGLVDLNDFRWEMIAARTLRVYEEACDP
jgi:glycosyltransferase involved in cell wall biosynthesis